MTLSGPPRLAASLILTSPEAGQHSWTLTRAWETRLRLITSSFVLETAETHLRMCKRVQLVDPTLTESINPQQMFQHLESCRPTPTLGLWRRALLGTWPSSGGASLPFLERRRLIAAP